MILEKITDHIGNTPLLRIPREIHGLQNIELYAKLEFLNPWGSVKDRTAWALLQPHLDELTTKNVIENSSGNTAKALQMIAGMHGSQLKIMTNLIKVSEVKDILTIIGTNITELPGTSDCFDPNDPNDPSYYIEREMQDNPGSYLFTEQFLNQKNQTIHYETTGMEIARDLPIVDYFIGGVGTAGSTLGVADRLQEDNPDLTLLGIVAAKDDFLPGIRTYEELLGVGLFDPERYDKTIPITSDNALDAMATLVSKTGLPIGPSTGASYAGALEYLQQIDTATDKPRTAVFIACDRIEWYGSYIKQRKPEWFGGSKKQTWLTNLEIDENVNLSTEETQSLLQSEHTLIVDLRQPISFKTARIPNSINLPYEYLNEILNVTNPFCTEQTVVCVCPIGEKSEVLASFLRAHGVRAYSVQGGITAWRDDGAPLERDHIH